MSDAELVAALVESSVPRSDELARKTAKRLFPVWQAVLVGAPVALLLAGLLGLVVAVVVALPIGVLFVPETPKPAWFGHMSEAAMLVGAALGVWIVVRWMMRRFAFFAALARDGALVETSDRAATGLAGALGTSGGRLAARMVLGNVGSTVAQVFGGPIAVAEHDGVVVEARTAATSGGNFRVPELMLVDADGKYVGLLHRAGWIVPQRVLSRTRVRAVGVPASAN